MYKIKPTSNSKIAQGSSKKVIKSALPSIHKQNLLLDLNTIYKTTDKQSNKQPLTLKYGQILQPLELKLTQPCKSPPLEKKKAIRPWAAKLLETNASNLLTERVRVSSQKSKELWHERKSSLRESFLKSKQLQYYNSQLKPNDECIDTVRFLKANSTREKSMSKDKTATCKIALKKSIFPTTQKQYQHNKLAQCFEREEDLLSTINKNEGEERFISIESYTNLVF